jgi:hypothetical protein
MVLDGFEPDASHMDVSVATIETTYEHSQRRKKQFLEFHEMANGFQVDDSRSFHVNKAIKSTLLDKVVCNVFGENRRLFEKFPKLAKITVPKYPVITPKGNEIINREQFRVSLELLNSVVQEKVHAE